MSKTVLVALSLTLLLPALAGAQTRTPPDSFLQYRVNSPEQFIRQVEANPVVKARMAKHFGVSQAELVSYLRKNLTVVTVKASGRYPVYGVTRTGRIYRSSDYFRRGWRAYGLKNGTVLFKWSCGNPMVAALPKVEEVAAVAQHTVPQPVAPPVEMAPTVNPPEEPAMTVAMAHEWDYPSVAQVPDTPVYEVAPLVQVLRPSWLPGWLSGLPLFFFDDDDHKHPPVPEPGTMLLLGTGLSLVAMRSVRRSRRR